MSCTAAEPEIELLLDSALRAVWVNELTGYSGQTVSAMILTHVTRLLASCFIVVYFCLSNKCGWDVCPYYQVLFLITSVWQKGLLILRLLGSYRRKRVESLKLLY